VRDQLHLTTSIPVLLASLGAATDGNSNIINITYSDPKPANAARIANAFAAQYAAYEDQTTRAQYNAAARSAKAQLNRMSSTQRSSADGIALAQRLQQLQLAASLDTSGVRVLDQAAVPTSPASPRPKMIIVLALILGLALGCCAALGLAKLAAPAAARRPLA
jgi:uncharacterized protein involved in exopolysaccharide biosynthesis